MVAMKGLLEVLGTLEDSSFLPYAWAGPLNEARLKSSMTLSP